MSKTSIEATGADAALRRFALSGPTMGTRWSAVFHAPESLDPAALSSRLQRAVEEVDRQMSNWKPDSDLNRLNAAPVGTWVAIPRNLLRVLATGLAVGQASGGAFDMGVGDLVRSWGFGPDPGRPVPSSRPAAAEGQPTGAAPFRSPPSLQLDEAGGRARKLLPLALDLSGIAKGFGVDELARVMEEAGLGSWLVGIDGEMRAAGRKPDGRPWLLAHERPVPGSRDMQGLLHLEDAAVATSGTYRHRTEVEGRVVSHVMDPGTGAPLAGDLSSVTVLASTCMAADAWATAILVAGSREGARLAHRFGLDVVLVRTDGSVEASL